MKVGDWVRELAWGKWSDFVGKIVRIRRFLPNDEPDIKVDLFPYGRVSFFEDELIVLQHQCDR
jgi:hypothetical protein